MYKVGCIVTPTCGTQACQPTTGDSSISGPSIYIHSLVSNNYVIIMHSECGSLTHKKMSSTYYDTMALAQY